MTNMKRKRSEDPNVPGMSLMPDGSSQQKVHSMLVSNKEALQKKHKLQKLGSAKLHPQKEKNLIGQPPCKSKSQQAAPEVCVSPDVNTDDIALQPYNTEEDASQIAKFYSAKPYIIDEEIGNVKPRNGALVNKFEKRNNDSSHLISFPPSEYDNYGCENESCSVPANNIDQHNQDPLISDEFLPTDPSNVTESTRKNDGHSATDPSSLSAFPLVSDSSPGPDYSSVIQTPSTAGDQRLNSSRGATQTRHREIEKTNLKLLEKMNPDSAPVEWQPCVTARDIPLVAKSYCYTDTNPQRIIVTMLPTDQILMYGVGYVECLLGSVHILGYNLRQGDKMPAFAPQTEAPLIIQGYQRHSMVKNQAEEQKIEKGCMKQKSLTVSIVGEPIIAKKIKKGWIPFEGSKIIPDFTDSTKHLKSHSTDCVDENFKLNLLQRLRDLHCTSLDKKIDQLKLEEGQHRVVLEVTEFPCQLLERALRRVPGFLPEHCFAPMLQFSHRKERKNSKKRTTLVPVNRAIKNCTLHLTNEKMPIYIPYSWRQVARQICLAHQHRPFSSSSQAPGVRVMVMGDRAVGKNTLVRYLANALLSAQTTSRLLKRGSGLTSEQQAVRRAVCVMDLDPRQPEQSLPCLLSTARHTCPMLGPSHMYGASHQLRKEVRRCELSSLRGNQYTSHNNFSDDDNFVLGQKTKEILLGKRDTLVLVARAYVAAAAELMNTVCKEHSKEPLIVNTAAIDFTENREYLFEIMKIINPTHVIHISGSLSKTPRYLPMTSRRVNSIMYKEKGYDAGLRTAFFSSLSNEFIPQSPHLTYKYARIPSVNESIEKSDFLKCDQFRSDLTVASFLSALWPQHINNIDSLSCQNSVRVPYDNVAIHIQHSDLVPLSHMLLCIRFSLVALCFINPKHILTTGAGLPNLVRKKSQQSNADRTRASNGAPIPIIEPLRLTAEDDELIDPTPNVVYETDELFTFLGWAVVRGIDPVTKELYLLVPQDWALLNAVNVIVKPDMSLPNRYDKMFYEGPHKRFVSAVPRRPWNTAKGNSFC